MIRSTPALAAVVMILSAAAVNAQPQVPGGGVSRPTFSPYLNLLGGGVFNNPALTYYGIVRPQQQYAQQLGQLQQQLTITGQQIDSMGQSFILPPTGNVPVFNMYGGYFNRIGVGGGLGGSVGMGGIGGIGGMMGGGVSGFNTISGAGGVRGGFNPGGMSGMGAMSINRGGMGIGTGAPGMSGGFNSIQPSFSRPSGGIIR